MAVALGVSTAAAGELGKGLSYEAAATLDYIANVDGGLSRDSAFLGNVDLTLELDTEDAGLWNGGTFFVYGLGNLNDGTLPTEIIGDIQGTCNIEAPETFKLYELWYDHSFMNDRVAVLVGLHDYNSEFDVMEYAGVFLNSSFGIAPQISQFGPSIFPTTALALRLAVKPTDDAYFLAAVYDGVPGDPDDEKSGSIQLSSDDGTFTGAEIGLTPGENSKASYYKLAVGGWYHTAQFEDLDGITRDSNGGMYLIAEAQVCREEDASQGLGIFAQYGNTFEDFCAVDYSILGGLNYTGLIPGRDKDVVALGVASAVVCSAYKDLEENAGMASAETAIELVYEAAVSEWLIIKPDIQFVINPLSAPGIENAVVLGLRVEARF